MGTQLSVNVTPKAFEESPRPGNQGIVARKARSATNGAGSALAGGAEQTRIMTPCSSDAAGLEGSVATGGEEGSDEEKEEESAAS